MTQEKMAQSEDEPLCLCKDVVSEILAYPYPWKGREGSRKFI